MIFMEECFVRLPKENDLYTLNPYYIRNKNTFNALKTDISLLFPSLNYIPFSNIDDNRWDCIYMSSFAPNVLIDKLDSVDYKKIVLVEDGLFDYISPEDDYTFYNNKELFLFRPQLASTSTKQARVHSFVVSEEVIDRFNSIYSKELEKLSQLDNDTMILFTTPLEEDFYANNCLISEILDFIDKTFAPKKIVLKRHPRDFFTYESSSIEIIECPKNIPGQLLDKMFDGLKVFLFPSTVSFMCGELSDIVFINVLPDNKEYNRTFSSIVDSNLFNNKKHIKILSMKESN